MRHLLPCLTRHRHRRQRHRVQVEKRLADRLRQSCRQVQNPPFIFPPQPYFPATAVPRYPAGVRSATTFSTTRSILLVFLAKASPFSFRRSPARPRRRKLPFFALLRHAYPWVHLLPHRLQGPLFPRTFLVPPILPAGEKRPVSRQLPRRRQRAKLKQPQIRSRIAVREETPDQIQSILWHAQFPQRNALDRGALRLIFPLFLPDVCDGFLALFSSPFPRRVFPAKIPPMASRVKRLSFPHGFPHSPQIGFSPRGKQRDVAFEWREKGRWVKRLAERFVVTQTMKRLRSHVAVCNDDVTVVLEGNCQSGFQPL